uniref:Protein kinase domain-containing protein n=1 Tax=Chlamydomonas leiostraca TaxID=1034604 RepID=A0A7S0RS10_9CHLO|mmetsp:Transcript_3012/g.7478  ORF Transcript_3012/g.7478 Transcript_3012/m.7478 type:complete len:412 (+) Transcript_3012:324-1559(+)
MQAHAGAMAEPESIDSVWDALHEYTGLNKSQLQARGLEEEDVACLAHGKYKSAVRFQVATREGLAACELSPASMDVLLKILGKDAAASPTPSSSGGTSVVAAFKKKLAEHNINRPHERTMSRLVVCFSRQLEFAAAADAPSDAAVDLYKLAEKMPGSTTRSTINQQLGLILNGPWQEGHLNLITGIDSANGGRPVVLKLLYTHEEHLQLAAAAEVHAAQVLGLGQPSVPLVPSEVVTVNVHPEGTASLGTGVGQRTALKMGWYVGSLLVLPQLNEALIAAGGRRMCTALSYMHAKNLVHMDVKPANILMDSAGLWFLSDFGSTTPVGQRVFSCTRGFYPGRDLVGSAATPEFDWGLLFVTLLTLCDKDDYAGLQDAAGQRMDRSKVLARSERIAHPELRSLLAEIRQLAGW